MIETTHGPDDRRPISPLEVAVSRLDHATGKVDSLREELRTARAEQREALAALRVVAHQRPGQGQR